MTCRKRLTRDRLMQQLPGTSAAPGGQPLRPMQWTRTALGVWSNTTGRSPRRIGVRSMREAGDVEQLVGFPAVNASRRNARPAIPVTSCGGIGRCATDLDSTARELAIAGRTFA